MIIRRLPSNDPWARVPKRVLSDANLSWQAKGLYAYLMGLPNDWTVHMNHLVTVSRNGKDSLQSAFRELKKAGLAVLVTHRSEGGKIEGKEWNIYDAADPGTEKRENRQLDFPADGEPADTKSETETKPEKKREAAAPTIALLPDFPDDPEVQELWENYIANRKDNKDPMTERGKAMALKKLRGWKRNVQIAALEHAIQGNWSSLYPKEEKKAQPMPYRRREDRINELNRKKQALIRDNAPYFKIHQIDMELSKL